MIEVEEIKITPNRAKEMLKFNNRNRPISLKRVSHYAAEMRRGSWKQNGDTICFNGSKLIDGQHRLLAVIEANTSIKTLVATGIGKDVFDTIDRGFTRTGGHILAIAGEVNANNLAAAVNICVRYSNRKHDVTMRNRVSTTQLTDFLAENPRIRDLTQWAVGVRKDSLVSASALAGLCFLCERGNLKLADEFFEKFLTGEKIRKNEPIGLLRQRLIRDANSVVRLRSHQILSLFIVAWNLTVRGGKIPAKGLQLPKDSRVPTIMRRR